MPHYHVLIRSTLGSRYNEYRPNVDLEWLQNRILGPWAEGIPITVNGKAIPIDQIHRITVKQTSSAIVPNSSRGDGFTSAKDVTDDFITDAPGSAVRIQASVGTAMSPPTDARGVFVVHGRNAAARDALFEFLRSIDLHPLEWSEAVQLTGKPMPYIGEILDAAFSYAHAIVVLLTPDDEARLREVFLAQGDPSHESELTGQARPNVLFEAGMAMSRDEARTILVELGDLRPFSDIAGRHTIRFDNSTQRRQELASRLRSSGCPVNLSGTDWHSAGDFHSAMESAQAPTYGNETLSQRALSDDARNLLLSAVVSSTGKIMKVGTMAGNVYSPTPPQIAETEPARLSARLEHALDELIKYGLVTPNHPFTVTHSGYSAADELGQQSLPTTQ